MCSNMTTTAEKVRLYVFEKYVFEYDYYG